MRTKKSWRAIATAALIPGLSTTAAADLPGECYNTFDPTECVGLPGDLRDLAIGLDWTKLDTGDGEFNCSLAGDLTFCFAGYEIVGGDAKIAGTTEISTVVPFAGTVRIGWDYFSDDIGDFDFAYYSIDSDQTIIATNDETTDPGGFPPSEFIEFDVPAGATLAIGVETTDGIKGAGALLISEFEYRTGLGVAAFDWQTQGDLNGDTFVTGSGLEIIAGANAKIGGSDESLSLAAESSMLADTIREFDARLTAQASHFAPIANLAEAFYFIGLAQNNIGPTFGSPESIDEPLPDQTDFGFGMEAPNGALDAQTGRLVVEDVRVEVRPNYVGDFDWGQTGDVDIDGTSIDVVGPDDDSGGIAEATGFFDKPVLVRAVAEYTSTDTGDFDFAYYRVNGDQTVITDNDDQGTFTVEFEAAPGGTGVGTISFGVESTDGLFGPGELTIRNLRLITKPVDNCEADFNADETLSVLDFIAFQEAFASGSMLADLNDDGMLNILDFPSFQSSFAGGCP